MLKIIRNRIVLLAAVTAISFGQNGFAASNNPRSLVSPELLKHVKLKIIWENELPIKKSESLERLLLFGNRFFVMTSHNYMISLNKKNGNIIFGKNIAPAGLPIVELMPYGDELISVDGSKLIEIDANTGLEFKTMDAGYSITCPATRNSSYFYLGGIDKRLHVLQADNRVQKFEVSADNESLITSINADDNFVIFSTAAGNIICIAPDKPSRLWQFNASKAIAGPIIREGWSLFFASKDTNVYRVDIVGLPERKQLIWKHQTAAVLQEEPRVTMGIVYQPVHGKGLIAIDKDTGSQMWSVPGGVDLLAESGSKAYVITKDRTLVVMDNVKAKKLYMVNFAGVSRYTSNIIDENIYIADDRGRIACLQPTE